MTDKHGEISINMIILIVIALIVLIIVVFLVVRSGDNYTSATSCASVGGVCKDVADCEYENQIVVDLQGNTVNQQGLCKLSTQVCCEPFG